MIQPVNQPAKKVLDVLTAELEPGQSRKITNSTAFMPVSVECLYGVRDGMLFSVTHYYEQNGDLVPDPDVTIWRDKEGNYWPCSIQHANGHCSKPLELEGPGEILHNPRAYRALRSFVQLWMRNIKAQQGLKSTRAA
ncbi:MAG TPA: hypothetical protein VGJ91_20165 [Polyangiaceae bacterium]|jgi:hypothetical protein